MVNNVDNLLFIVCPELGSLMLRSQKIALRKHRKYQKRSCCRQELSSDAAAGDDD